MSDFSFTAGENKVFAKDDQFMFGGTFTKVLPWFPIANHITTARLFDRVFDLYNIFPRRTEKYITLMASFHIIMWVSKDFCLRWSPVSIYFNDHNDEQNIECFCEARPKKNINQNFSQYFLVCFSSNITFNDGYFSHIILIK